MKHFQCNICHRKLNSASGLVIHMAQVHKENMEKVPNSVDGHDSPELEIYGMDGIPREDLQRHQDGLPIIPYTRGKLIIGDSTPVTKLLSEEPQESQPLVIPPYLDSNTNKMIPGTIFTVLSLDRSIEELRSELKKYKNNNIK
ncbi:DNA-binding transcription factor [Perkinsus sp. BL_2016]|nr:DNA-binding transcription factor [Perkinsus sp. BL_2016]